MILLDSFTGIIHNVSSSERSTLTIHFMRACRGSRLASARSFIFSVPPQSDRRSDFVPAVGGDFVLPTGQDFVREADFVPQSAVAYLLPNPWVVLHPPEERLTISPQKRRRNPRCAWTISRLMPRRYPHCVRTGPKMPPHSQRAFGPHSAYAAA